MYPYSGRGLWVGAVFGLIRSNPSQIEQCVLLPYGWDLLTGNGDQSKTRGFNSPRTQIPRRIIPHFLTGLSLVDMIDHCTACTFNAEGACCPMFVQGPVQNPLLPIPHLEQGNEESKSSPPSGTMFGELVWIGQIGEAKCFPCSVWEIGLS